MGIFWDIQINTWIHTWNTVWLWSTYPFTWKNND